MEVFIRDFIGQLVDFLGFVDLLVIHEVVEGLVELAGPLQSLGEGLRLFEHVFEPKNSGCEHVELDGHLFQVVHNGVELFVPDERERRLAHPFFRRVLHQIVLHNDFTSFPCTNYIINTERFFDLRNS